MKHILSVLFIALLSGCDVSTSYPVRPQYTDAAKMKTDLSALVKDAEEINISGQSVSENGKKWTALEIEIKNSPVIPKTVNQQQELARAIAKSLKQHLKNKQAFNTINVKFVSTEGGTFSAKSETVETIFENNDL